MRAIGTGPVIRARLLLLALACACAVPANAAQARPPDASTLRARIADALVRPSPQRFESHRLAHEPRIVALYFGADWCAPCHVFVPELRRVRDTLRDAGADTEVVYVSLDTSGRAMHRYMRSQAMPWPAIDRRRLQAMPDVQALGGIAPPNLVLLDRDGTVLASGWEGRRHRGLQPVLRTWVDALSVDDASPP